MKDKRFELLLVTIIVVAAATFTLSACSKKEQEEDSDDPGVQVIDLSNSNENQVDNTDPDTEEGSDTNETLESGNEDQDQDDEETVVSVTMKDFSMSPQSTGGNKEPAAFVLSSVGEQSQSDYHRFVFTLDYQGTAKSDTDDEDADGDEKNVPIPPLEARYRSDRGSVVVDLEGLTNDTSSIGYFSSKVINKDGITRLYHALVDSNTGERYEIGVNKNPEFRLYVDNPDSNPVKVILDVKYPGGSGRTNTYGSSDYSNTRQEIEGAEKSSNAGISTFSYLTAGGETIIQFDAKASAGSGVPKCYAEYQGGSLVLIFPSLKSHHTSSSTAQYQIAGVGTVDYSQSGDESRFSFPGVTNSEFRLSGETSPNQITLRVKPGESGDDADDTSPPEIE